MNLLVDEFYFYKLSIIVVNKLIEILISSEQSK